MADSAAGSAERRAVEALRAAERGDAHAVQDSFDPDVVWHVPGANPLAGDYRGPGGVLRYMRDLAARIAGRLTSSVHDVVVNLDPSGDCYVVVLEHRTIEPEDGERHDWECGEVLKLRDDRVVEAWLFHQDQSEVDDYLRTVRRQAS